MSALLALLVALLITIPALLLRGWATLLLWRWFVVPLGAPEIGLAQAIGVALAVSFATSGGAKGLANKSPEERIAAALEPFFMPLLVIGIGWVVKGFVP